jgi:hypothetical protein
MGVLGTMFGGVFLLSGGSSKAVQQSPPIKASSRGEEDFIQYVPNTTCAVPTISRKRKRHWANTYVKEILEGGRGRRLKEALS